MNAKFPPETMETIMQLNNIFKVLKEKKLSKSYIQKQNYILQK